MNKSSKGLRYTAIVVRVLLGLLFIMSGVSYFFMKEIPTDSLTPVAQQFMAALTATGYFFPFLKASEVVAGLMLLFKRWTPLALLILAPIILQILCFNIFLDGAALIMGVVIFVMAIFLAWYNWEKYEGLFRA